MTAGRGELGRGEWPATLEVGRLVSAGWRPVPFREFVLKIHSRCDLACDYCYMYTMADQSWHGRPMVMSRTVGGGRAHRRARAGTRAAGVELNLHGGEPLLAGPEFIGNAVSVLRRALPAGRPGFNIQTNGMRLDSASSTSSADSGSGSASASTDTAVAHDRHRRRRTARAATGG